MRERTELIAITVGEIATNCYFLIDTETKEAVIVDPGDEAGILTERIRSEEIRPSAILLTHGHGDHIFAVNDLIAAYPGIPVFAHKAEREMLEDPKQTRALFGVDYTVKDVCYIDDHDTVEAAGFRFSVLHTPGHTRGSVCYYEKEEALLFSGDTLFRGSCGRTDFPGGSSSDLLTSLLRLRTEIPDDVRILPGHMADTTMEFEKRMNPFL